MLYPAELSAHIGAGDGNRTHVASLEGWNSTIELHPQFSTRFILPHKSKKSSLFLKNIKKKFVFIFQYAIDFICFLIYNVIRKVLEAILSESISNRRCRLYR